MTTTSIDTPLAAGAPARRSFNERMLDRIEQAGNKIPHPAMLFVGLIVIVILASQIMSWAGVKATSEVATPPATQVQERQDGGSQYPSYTIPGEQAAPGQYSIHRETTKVEGPSTSSTSRARSSTRSPCRSRPSRSRSITSTSR